MFHVLWWSIMKWLDLKIELLPALKTRFFWEKKTNQVNLQSDKMCPWFSIPDQKRSSKVLHVFTADHHSTTASFLPLSFFFWLACWYRKYDIRYPLFIVKKPWHAHQSSRAARGGKSENSWFGRTTGAGDNNCGITLLEIFLKWFCEKLIFLLNFLA